MTKVTVNATDIFPILTSEFGHEEKSPLGFREDKALIERLDKAAEACGMSRSAFARCALRNAISEDDITPNIAGGPKQLQSLHMIKADVQTLTQAAKEAGLTRVVCLNYVLEKAVTKVESASSQEQMPETAPQTIQGSTPEA